MTRKRVAEVLHFGRVLWGRGLRNGGRDPGVAHAPSYSADAHRRPAVEGDRSWSWAQESHSRLHRSRILAFSSNPSVEIDNEMYDLKRLVALEDLPSCLENSPWISSALEVARLVPEQVEA